MKDLSGLCIKCGELRDLSVTRYGCLCYAYTKPKKQMQRSKKQRRRAKRKTMNAKPSWQGSYKSNPYIRHSYGLPVTRKATPKQPIKEVVLYEAQRI